MLSKAQLFFGSLGLTPAHAKLELLCRAFPRKKLPLYFWPIPRSKCRAMFASPREPAVINPIFLSKLELTWPRLHFLGLCLALSICSFVLTQFSSWCLASFEAEASKCRSLVSCISLGLPEGRGLVLPVPTGGSLWKAAMPAYLSWASSQCWPEGLHTLFPTACHRACVASTSWAPEETPTGMHSCLRSALGQSSSAQLPQGSPRGPGRAWE